MLLGFRPLHISFKEREGKDMQEEIQAAQRIVDLVVNFFVNYSFQVVGAIIILVVGLIVARSLASFLLKFFQKKDFDITLSKFIDSYVTRWAPAGCSLYLRSNDSAME